MKRIIAFSVCFFLSTSVFAQKKNNENEQTLLWKISGNGITYPSYLFGTIHMLCATDAFLSNNLKDAIKASDEVYLELDMDNLTDMLDGISNMKMKNDSTFKDLMNAADYQKVKNYFEKNNAMIPFSMLESFKPFFAASLMTQKDLPCDEIISMEEIVMKQSLADGKKIMGMETLHDQLEVFDKIPYQLQAKLLLQYIDSLALGKTSTKEFEELMQAYKSQDLIKFEALTKNIELGLADFTDLILYDRNKKWLKKLKLLLPQKSMVIAVGAGHLPGENGLIELLKKEGFILTAVENRKNTKEL